MQIEELVTLEHELSGRHLESLTATEIRSLKRKGFSDRRLARLRDTSELEFSRFRREHHIRPVYKRVDTCSAGFASATAYLYSSYYEECEA